MPEFIQRRLQVFVSSTYTDLREERQAAVEAILIAGHIPAGMELFTAGDESQMGVIKGWIEESDVYLLILGGRYGSIEPTTGKSYTQLEYEYALSLGIPVFACVIRDAALDARIKNQGRSAVETEHPDKLKEFKAGVLRRMCGFWDDSKDIKLITGNALTEITRHNNLSGWIRSNSKASSNSSIQLIATRRRELSKEFHDRKYSTDKFDLLAVAVKDCLKEIALDPESRMAKRILHEGTRFQVAFVHPASKFLDERAKEDKSDVKNVRDLQIESVKYVIMFYKKLQDLYQKDQKEILDRDKFGNVKIRLIDRNPYITIERFGKEMNWGIYTAHEEGKNCAMFTVVDKEDEKHSRVFDQLKHHFYDLLDHGEPLLTLTNGILDLNIDALKLILSEEDLNKLLR
jgi:hypothetical protein